MAMLLTALFAAAVLIAYIIIEKRINQWTCPECAFTLSLDAVEEHCPNCDAILSESSGPRINNRAGIHPPSRLGY